MSAKLHQFGARMNPRHSTADVTQPEWLDLKSLQRYACVSERTLREWIHRDSNPLPASRVGTKLLVRRSSFDRWLEAHRLTPVDVGCIVNEIVAGVSGPN
jgi:excisionase family DNA binding protein